MGRGGDLVSEDLQVPFKPEFREDEFREGHPADFKVSFGLESEREVGGPKF